MRYFGKNTIIQGLKMTVDREVGIKYVTGASNFHAAFSRQTRARHRIALCLEKKPFDGGMDFAGNRLKQCIDYQALRRFQ
jgi:hypothetical protein